VAGKVAGENKNQGCIDRNTQLERKYIQACLMRRQAEQWDEEK